MVTIVTLSFPYGHAPLSHREVEGHHGSICAFLSLVKAHAAFHFFFQVTSDYLAHYFASWSSGQATTLILEKLMHGGLMLFLENMKFGCTSLNSMKINLKMNFLFFFYFLYTINY